MTPEQKLTLAREALEQMCLAAEYWAGCDEGCDPDTAASEIMSSGGAWPSVAYNQARQALVQLNAPASDGDGEENTARNVFGDIPAEGWKP